MVDILDDMHTIAELLRISPTGAQHHFDWRYTETLAHAGIEEAERLADWYRSQIA